MQEHFKTETTAMPLASMETRRMVAEDTRNIIEQAFASGEPYANFEIFRNLFYVEKILDVRSEFVFKINIEKFGNPVAAGQLVRTYATEIHYFNFPGESLTEKIARACEFESNSGNEDKIPIEIKTDNFFCSNVFLAPVTLIVIAGIIVFSESGGSEPI